MLCNSLNCLGSISNTTRAQFVNSCFVQTVDRRKYVKVFSVKYYVAAKFFRDVLEHFTDHQYVSITGTYEGKNAVIRFLSHQPEARIFSNCLRDQSII